MTRPVFTEQGAASVGPIELKEPGSPVWCWQTVSKLQSEWDSVNIDLGLYEKTWEDAEKYRIWEKIPYEAPYGTKEEMLSCLEVGDVPEARAKVAAKAMDTRPLGRQNGTNGHNMNEVDARQLDQGGNSRNYLIAKIARDAPEVWERMKRGEFKSVAEAAREAGIKLAKAKKTVTLSDNVDRVADRLRGHYSPDQVRQIRERLAQDSE